MNCKHFNTKTSHCGAKEKAIDKTECANCILKLPTVPKEFDDIFKSFVNSG